MGQQKKIPIFQFTAMGLGAIVALLGGVVFSNWIFFNSLVLRNDWATMKANTALGFLCAGTALALQALSAELARNVGRTAAAMALVFGSATLAEYLGVVELGIDQVFIVDPATPANLYPGRMAPITALNFVLIACSLLFIDTPAKWQRIFGEIAATLVTTVSFFVLLGYLYGVDTLYNIHAFSSIAPHTAAAFLALSVGVILVRRDTGLMRHILSPNAGGVMIRRLLPAAIVVPIALGWLRLVGQEHGLYQLQLGAALHVVANVVVLIALVLWTAKKLDEVDTARAFNQRIFETSPDLILIVDRKGNFVRVNPSVTKILNYRVEDMVGHNAIEFIFSDDLDATRHEMRFARRNGSKSAFECRYVHKDGSLVTLAWTGIWSESEQQHIFIGRDMGERQRAEAEVRRLNEELEERVQQRTAELKESEARAARAHARLVDGIESLKDGFLLWDADDRLIVCNEASRHADVESGKFLIPGRRYVEILQLRARSGHIPETAGRENAYISHRLARHTNPTGEPLEQMFDNGQWVSVREQRTREGGVVSIRTDITERKRAEAEIRDLNRQLEKRLGELAATNSELETFSYSVSHDLRAPLRGIDAFSQALLEDFADRLDDDGRDYLMRIRRAAQHMGLLIDDLLQLARITRIDLKISDVDLGAQARGILQELQSESPFRHVQVSVPFTLPAKGDPRLLRIVLENLLSNAWKFTGACESACIEFDAIDDVSGTLTYFVRDNGAGFDMAYAGKLFGAFQRLHKSSEFPGTGVGLATVQRIINKHGGRIWAEAEVGKGAVFYFTL